MAQRKNHCAGDDEACAPLPPPRVPMAVYVGNEVTCVTLDPPMHEPRSGACRCGACLAAALTEHPRFV